MLTGMSGALDAGLNEDAGVYGDAGGHVDTGLHEDAALIDDIYLRLRTVCDAEGGLVLETPGGPVFTDGRYELRELARDIAFAQRGGAVFGDPGFFDVPRAGRSSPEGSAETRSGHVLEQAATVAETLAGSHFSAFLTDRDGTVNGYCARYVTAVQPAWVALALSRFAHSCCDRAVVLTAAPLEGPGLTDISTMAHEAAVLAGSKGREFRSEDGARVRQRLPESGAQALEQCSLAVSRLYETERYRLFPYIGGGLQRKHGLTSVSYQDVGKSVPAALSAEFRERVVAEVDAMNAAAGTHEPPLGWEDTGRDLEVSLREGVSGGHGFDKGDGVRYLAHELDLDLDGRRVLVCGDTASDIPMVEQALALGARVETVFVAASVEVKETVSRLVPGALFVDEFESLVIGLNMLVPEEANEYDFV
ncbi:MAG: hypothetical protein ACOC0B_02360 [bacterium]